MNVDVTYYHNNAYRLTVYTTYAELANLSTGAKRTFKPDSAPDVKRLDAEGMDVFINAGKEPKRLPMVGDIWRNRGGDTVAVYKRLPNTGRFMVLALTGHNTTGVYQVNPEGGWSRHEEPSSMDLTQYVCCFL